MATPDCYLLCNQVFYITVDSFLYIFYITASPPERFVGGSVECPICGAGEETVAHFVTECKALDGVRRRFGVGRGDPLEVVLLFGGRTGDEVERTTKMLEEMYGARRKKMEEQVDGSAQQ